MEVSRRQFLVGLGLAGVAAAGAGLAGCTPQGDNSSGGGSTGTGPGSSDKICQAYLNPQDYDYRQNTTDLKTLFSPIKIGPVQLNHRMIKSAAGSATYLAGPGDEILQYYVNLAKGGLELIWVEGIPWLEDGVDRATGQPLPMTQEGSDFAKKLVEECGKAGAKLGYQWAPFGLPVTTMPKEQIASIQAAGAKIAQNRKAEGFVGIEINAAGFNQGEQFLSRFHNNRTDEYGAGSLENRARFCTECITQIKQACGNDFVVQMLIDCIEENDNLTNDATLMTADNAVTLPHNLVTTIEEGIEFAKLFETAGADSMHLRLGPLGNHPCQFGSDLYFILSGIEGANGYGRQWDFSRHWQGQIIGNHSGAGMLLDIVARYKQAVSIPCGTVTYMDPAHAPDFFEQALIDGKVDFYLMNRPLTVDNDYILKLKAGKIDEIAPCTRCLHCHIGGNQQNRDMGYCRVNALTQRVMSGVAGTPDTYELPPVTKAKKVMVIGGGPGGMEAARIAAARGHQVSLYEKSGALGGLLEFANNVKGPHENLPDLTAYLKKQCELAGVNIVLNKAVDAALVSSEAPDAVVVATGGLRQDSTVSNDGSVPVVNYNDFMTAEVGDTVVILGANVQAWDCALWLTVHKKKVILVTDRANKDLDSERSQHAQRFMTTALYSLGVKVWSGSKIKEVKNGQMTITTDFGTTVSLPCNTIIAGAEMKADSSLLNSITVAEKYAVGDCAKPYNIALAIRAGNDVGRAL